VTPGIGSAERVSTSSRLAAGGQVSALIALVAAAVWLGGLVVLGAVAAPTIFAVIAPPASAHAMTIVFRRFDSMAMSCAAIVLATEAIRPVFRLPFAPLDMARLLSAVAAAALAVLEGEKISPRIAELHFAGVARGVGDSGMELARWHDWAERCGQGQVLFLIAFIALHVMSLSRPIAPDGTEAMAARGQRGQ
jgi:hypothetical protein